jgi:hypothetical protein
VLLLSGSTSFIAGILGRCGFNSSYICALDLDSKPSEHLLGRGTWYPFWHIDYGGVTSGTWWFGANIKDWTQPQPTRSALQVGHVLSDTVGGKPCPGPVEPETTMDEVTYLLDSRVLDAGGLFPVKAVRTLVACPSVYSQLRWVAWCLFTHELGRCFDLGKSSLQPFPDKPISNVKIPSLPFLLSPLVRIALAVGNECARLLPQSPKELSVPIPENLTKEDSVMAAPLVTEESTCGCENEEAFDPEAEFGREKAAKNDDAGISTGLWDARVWSLWKHDTLLSARISAFEAEFGQGP